MRSCASCALWQRCRSRSRRTEQASSEGRNGVRRIEEAEFATCITWSRPRLDFGRGHEDWVAAAFRYGRLDPRSRLGLRTVGAQIIQGELASDRRRGGDEGGDVGEWNAKYNFRAGRSFALADGVVAGEGVDDQVDGRRGTVGG